MRNQRAANDHGIGEQEGAFDVVFRDVDGAVSGDVAGARKTLADLKQLAQGRYVSAIYFACIYTGLGDNKMAMDWLDKAYKERNDRLVYLNVDPMADSLRSSPRFQVLLQKLGLMH